MTTIEKDITTVESGTIVHQVNCLGVMGSDVARVIRKKWPQVYTSYKKEIDLFSNHVFGEPILGKITVCKISNELAVVNLFGQKEFRRAIDDRYNRFTSYSAWEEALRLLKKESEYSLPAPIYFPYNVGCNRGGGDWRIISAMIEEHFPDAIFCKWPPKK